MTKTTNWKFWIGLLISALFLYLAFRKVDLAQMGSVIKSADLFYLSLAVLLLLFQYFIRTWRWRILLEPVKNTGFRNRFSSIIIGFAANCLLPARLGEFIRASYLGKSEEMSISSTFGTIVVERLFDGLTLLLVLVIGVFYTTFPQDWHSFSRSLKTTGLLLFAFYIILIVFLIGFKYKAKPFLGLLDRLLFFLPERFRTKCIDILWKFSLGIALLKHPYRWIQAVFYSFLLWFVALVQIHFVNTALDITLPFLATCLIMTMGSFGVMIPSAPGFIGTFHLTIQYGYLFYGIGRTAGLSAAILLHAAFFIPTIFMGLLTFLFLHIPISRLSHTPGEWDKP